MKTTYIILIILFTGGHANATVYYINNNGNDLNNGLTQETAWRTISKVNNMFRIFKAGTRILFKRDEVFYGSLIVTKSGTVTSLIEIGAYGTGNNPIITGFTNVTSWTKLNGNRWESKTAVSTLPTCNMVIINGTEYAMGRFPNTNYLTYQSHVKNTAITSTDLTGTPDWTGA